MEHTKTPDASAMPSWIYMAFAAVVSADVILAVFRHWKGYIAIEKMLAVVLLMYLVVMPAAATWGRIRRYDWQSLLPAYMVLMLATMLFGMR